MKYLITINKFIEGILWLYLPLVFIYWALTPLTFSFIPAFRDFIGKVIAPAISFLDSQFNFKYSYEDSSFSYTPLVLAGVVVLSISITILVAKLLNIFDTMIRKTKLKISSLSLQKEKEKENQSFLKELDRNKYIYVMLKIIKIQQHEEYLVRNEDNAFSAGLLDSYETSIVNLARKFSGKEYGTFDAGPDVHNLIFSDVEKFLQYLKFLNKRIQEINKGTAELNAIFSCQIASICGYSTATIDTDLSLVSKILNLCSKDDVLITDTLKHKIEALNTNINIKLEPKGIYLLNQVEVDVFTLKFL